MYKKTQIKSTSKSHKKYILDDNSINKFKTILINEEKKPQTIKKYMRDIIKLKEYAAGRPVNKELLITYKEHLKKDCGYKTTSINSFLAVINTFVTEMGWNNLKIKMIKVQKETFVPENKEISINEYKALINAAIKKGDERKAGYEHFMMKEIHEQPKAVKDTLNSVLKDGKLDLSAVELTNDEIKKISQIYIVACGSAYHVGVVTQYVIEDLAKIPVRVELASEFRYRKPLLDPDGLVIVISQSGETADSLAALRLAKDKGLKTLGIVNVVGSSIAREADNVFYTLAGPEIAVATTKAYSTQLIAAYCLALQFAYVRGEMELSEYERLLSEIETIPEKIKKILEDKERLQWFAAKVANSKDIFFIGRGIDYAVSLEGSLKLKEISYIHSEAYAAGELKHGTISLIEDNILVIGVLTQSELYEKTVSNMVECKSRGAYLCGLTTYGKYEVEDTVDFTTYIPKIDEHFSASLAVVPLQLLGYYVSVAKGLDVDKPRNLAKSVTVE